MDLQINTGIPSMPNLRKFYPKKFLEDAAASSASPATTPLPRSTISTAIK